MGINITTVPVDVTVDGVSFQLQGDPTNSQAWATLLETEIAYGTKQGESHTALIEALAGLAETPADAETIKGLECGTRTLDLVSRRYVEAVTGFPTQPSKSSTKK